MRKALFIALPLLMLGSAAMAQGKIDTKWHCEKATTENKLDVGDMPDHSYSIAQGTCAASSSNKGFEEKTGQYTEFREGWKATMSLHGRFNATMDNGDMLHYTYTSSGSTDITKPISNKWQIVSGTGKHKGIKGSGTCTGKANADGSNDLECKGTYTMGKMDSMDKMKM